MNALGIIEVYSFSTAVCCADEAAKAADVKVIAFDRNRPISPDVPAPLVMAVKLEGSVSSVSAAVAAGEAFAKKRGKFIVSHIIANPGTDVDKMAYRMDINKDKFNKKLPKTFLGLSETAAVRAEKSSIALLEVQGLVASIEGLDAMLKTAAVRLVHTEKRLGGRLVTTVICGSVSAVSAAAEAGKASAAPLGTVYGCEVIANPHSEILKFFDMEN